MGETTHHREGDSGSREGGGRPLGNHFEEARSKDLARSGASSYLVDEVVEGRREAVSLYRSCIVWLSLQFFSSQAMVDSGLARSNPVFQDSHA